MITRLRLRRRDEQGAALVEFVLVVPILILLLLGTAEMGLAIRDWLTVTSASRAGARVGSAAGNAESADQAILAAVEAAMSTSDFSSVTSVEVYRVEPDGSEGPSNCYTPSGGGVWTPCGGGAGWPPANRNVSLGNLDTLAVRVNFRHEWITGVLGLADADWSDSAVMRIEPQEF